MLVNKYRTPYLTHNEYRMLSDSNIIEIYDFGDKSYYQIQFLDGTNCTTKRLLTAIPEAVRKRIRNNQLTLVLGNQLEAFHSTVKTAYEKFVIELDLPEEQLVIFTSSPNIAPTISKYAKEYNRKEIKAVWTRIYEYYAASVEIHNIKTQYVDKKNKTFDKKFVCLNRRWRPHRANLVALLTCKNLLNQGYVSLADCEGGNWKDAYDRITGLTNDTELKTLLEQNKEKILNLPNLYVDTSSQEGNVDTFRNELLPFYENTYFSVVTETPFYTKPEFGFDNGIHLSEKTFKVITQRHPFILLNAPYALKALHSIGYKTFSPLIDESYDEELDDDKRLLKIVNEIEKLCKLEGDELQDFLARAEEICEHNYQNLIKDNRVLGRYCMNLN